MGVVSTDAAPKAIGPYSQARKAGKLLFCSGQIGIDPQTGELVAVGIEAQTKQVMENIRQILLAADMTFDNVLKTTVFIADMSNFQSVNSIYGTYFANQLPARSCVEISALPKNALVEVEVIASTEN